MQELTNIREAFDTFCEQTEDLTRMTPEQQYQQLFEQMYALCEANEWGDPFSYARSREIHMACLLYTSPSPRDATLSRMPSSA